MVLTRVRSKQGLFASLLILVLVSNYLAYRLPAIPLPADSRGVVIGSLLDFAIIAPLLILAMTRKKGFTLKRFFTFMVIGLVAARFVIPAQYFEPFRFIPYVAIGFEAILLFAEISLLFLLAKHLPGILREVRREKNIGTLFAFPALVKEKVSTHPIVSIIAAESLMFYYAFASWKRKPPVGENQFTLHKKTSMIAFNVMLIHAIVIETIGIHWWLHGKSMILSIVLLILNVYSIIYVLADIQIVRLTPLTMNDDRMQISLGLGKRMEIPYDAIGKIEWGNGAEQYNLKSEGLIEFIARDFEEVKPQCILHFSRPLQATLFLGLEKEFHMAAIRVDDPKEFREMLETKKRLPLPK
ncbi:beta-carotene 15,15'-monooxygenase [Sporosarcina sp. ACRSL]|uniref:beta-carotene 15,15'-monooxygenase n=1 Tax=Sporosarcina sp. ACRSL TaxID=2918215 RepID=UPI001EF55E89|nr:beta-carotene 15,15'-monooxygenase [Sporosarcina sp. ACRSL]MCG7343512.1 beta-carotene 15,15'-monooxygenase [Sporosarcina sp. ACRSL]